MPASQIGQGARNAADGLLVKLVRRVFSFPAALGILLVAGAFLSILAGLERVRSNLSAASRFWFQGDTWWHLAVGQRILATHSRPGVDIYSFTMHGKPWIAYEWFGDVVMAALWRIGGLEGLMVFLTALAGTALILLFYYSYLRSGNLTSSFVACAALLPLATASFSVRPQMLGYVFLLITLIALERFRQGHPKMLWALPVVFLVWVNTHGTFVLGSAAIAIYLVSGCVSFRRGVLCAHRWTGPQRRQLGLIILLCGAASLVTPYGVRLAIYPVEMKFFQPVNLTFVSEWQPFPLSTISGAMLVAWLLLVCIAILTSRLKFQLPDFILLVLAAVETLLHARFILLFVPVFAPFLAEFLARWLPQHQAREGRPLVNALLMACVAAGIVGFFPSGARLQAAVKSTAPVEAASFISSRSGLGRMFTYYDWGSYLIFSLGPTHRVFMDGRLDLYESGGVLQDYLGAIWTRQGFWDLLRKYNIQSCLLPKASPMTKFLRASPRWKEAYRDPIAVIFIKK